jgi:hypothetical protein
MEPDSSDGQLSLPFSRDEGSFRHLLAEGFRSRFSIILTENSTTLLSARLKAVALRIRIHQMFRCADDQVLAEIVTCLRKKQSYAPLSRSLSLNEYKLHRKPPKKAMEPSVLKSPGGPEVRACL